jgi:outer membrane protein, adhesin transport system
MKKMKRLLFSILLIAGLVSSLQAQHLMTLDEFVDAALVNNYSLLIVRNNEAVAAGNVTRGNAGLLPSLDMRASYGGNLNNSNQQFANGGDARIRNIHNTALQTGVQGAFMLFDGFRGQIRYRQLEELKQLSEINTRLAIENMIAGIASEYYYYIQQRQLFNNLRYAVTLSRERVRIEQEHFLLGSGSKVRLLQAEVNLNADSSRLERQYEVLRASRIRLAEYMAAQNLEAGFIPADTSIVINNSLVYDELYNDVMANNAAILQAQQNKIISQADLDLVYSNRLPYLNLNTGYGYNINTYQSGTLSSQQTWGMNYGLTLGINIYNGGNQRRLQSNARIALENTQLTAERVKQDATGDLITLFNSYTNNIRLLTLEHKNLELARENLEIAFERYRLGGLSGFELREVQKNLLEAEERLLSIQYQAKMGEINLLQLAGRLLS